MNEISAPRAADVSSGAHEKVGKGSTAVRAQKRPRLSDGAPWQKLELFPTPPWATRALFEHVLPVLGMDHKRLTFGSIWEPAAGLGHMSDVLREFSPKVWASDAHIYPLDGGGDTDDLGVDRLDFFDGTETYLPVFDADWIITNPPFGLAAAFLDRALDRARCGIAFFVRLQWLESAQRYEIFAKQPPTLYAPFAERVALCEGGLDPDLQGATAHGWFVWKKDAQFSNGIAPPFSKGFLSAPPPDDARPAARVMLDTFLIPPGCKAALTMPSDAKLAARCVPGFVPPSVLKKAGKAQARMQFGAADA